jgi:hypothetical protein
MKMTFRTIQVRLTQTFTVAGLAAVMALPASAQFGQFGGQTGTQFGAQVQPGVGGAVQRGIAQTARGAVAGQRFGDAVRQGVDAGLNPQFQQQQWGQTGQQWGQTGQQFGQPTQQ